MNEIIEMLSDIIKSNNEAYENRVTLWREALTASTLPEIIERYIALLHVDVKYIRSDVFAAFMAFCASPYAPDALNFVRRNPAIVIMTASLAEEDRREAVKNLKINHIPTDSVVRSQRKFDIGIRLTALSPLAHFDIDTIKSKQFFRRQQVLAKNGAILNLPYISGNALRGTLRQLLASHFLRSIGLQPNRENPPVALWFYYMLFSGGTIGEVKRGTDKIASLVGANGLYNADGIRKLRDMVPLISLFGCAVITRILRGGLYTSDLRPLCREWGNGDIPVDTMFETHTFSRFGSSDDMTGTQQMLYSCEAMKIGTQLEGGIDWGCSATMLERSALGYALTEFARDGYIGCFRRLGFGKVAAEFDKLPDPIMYLDYIGSNKDNIIAFLTDLGALDLSSNTGVEVQPKRRGKKPGRKPGKAEEQAEECTQ